MSLSVLKQNWTATCGQGSHVEIFIFKVDFIHFFLLFFFISVLHISIRNASVKLALSLIVVSQAC